MRRAGGSDWWRGREGEERSEARAGLTYEVGVFRDHDARDAVEKDGRGAHDAAREGSAARVSRRGNERQKRVETEEKEQTKIARVDRAVPVDRDVLSAHVLEHVHFSVTGVGVHLQDAKQQSEGEGTEVSGEGLGGRATARESEH